MAFRHTLRQQTLDLAVASRTVALTLQPRLGDLNRRRLLPVIEKVFDALDVPGRCIHINKLEIDLGRIPLATFEATVERRLESELRRALEAALREIGGAEGSGMAGNVARSEQAARRELLERLLLHGTLPFWAPRDLSLEELVLEMAEHDAEGLAETVYRFGRERRVLERLVLQLREPGLHELIRSLEPEHAALILAYLGHLREAHRGERVLPLADAAFSRALWLLTQIYLVHDPGSQFNRLSFVRSLLHGLAAREGLAYATILTALRRGLERLAMMGSVGTSLPGVIEQLIREVDGARIDPQARPTELPEASRPEPFERLLERLCPEESEVLAGLMRLFASLPAPYRPRPEERVRRVLLDEALRLQAGEPLSAISFARVLHELFPSPLPNVVHRFLLREAGTLPAGVELFISAVESAASRGSQPELSEPQASLRPLVEDRRVRQRWTKLLPESTLAQIVQRLAPRRHRALLDAAEVLTAAWAEVAERAALKGRRMMWSFLLEFLARHRGGDASVERLTSEFFAYVGRRVRRRDASRGAIGERLLENARRRAHAAGRGNLVAALHHNRSRLLATWQSPSRRSSNARRTRDESASGSENADLLYVDNAGLVLAAPFLPRLFEKLELLEKDEAGKVRLRTGDAASRAVHLLQFLVDGRTSVAEPALVLNKLLCGLPPATPIENEIEPTDAEREICESLLRSLLANWKTVANTSIAGLRETFFQREGKLERTSDGWKLQVQRKTVDVLVDEVPWGFSVIFHTWMPEPLHVSW